MNIFTYNFPIDLKSSGIRTIKDLKTNLKSSGYDIVSAKLILSNGKLVAPEVFQTNLYDDTVITTLLEGASMIVYTEENAPKNTLLPDILPTKLDKTLTSGNKTYYVVVDTGYERYDEISMPGRSVNQEPFKLISINHQPTNPSYDRTVRFLHDIIPRYKSMKQFTNNPIFETKDISSVTINRIINYVRSMEYCEIWGEGHSIVQYPINQNTILVRLNLSDVEAG